MKVSLQLEYCNRKPKIYILQNKKQQIKWKQNTLQTLFKC